MLGSNLDRESISHANGSQMVKDAENELEIASQFRNPNFMNDVDTLSPRFHELKIKNEIHASPLATNEDQLAQRHNDIADEANLADQEL